MKKWMIALLAVLTAAGLASCGKSGGESPSVPDSATSPVTEESEEPTPEDIATHVSVDHILMAIASAYGDAYPANAAIPQEVLAAEFGLASDLYEEAKGEMAAISVNNDRVVVAKAAPGKADDLEKAMQAAREKKIADTLQYPMNIPKTNAAKVVRQGDYVAFLLVGVLGEVEDAQSPEAKKQAEEQVQIAVDAFYGAFEN